MPGHVRKYNVPEASEVATLVVDEQHREIDIVSRNSSEYDANGFEKLEFINIVHRIYHLLAYPSLFPYRNEGWSYTLKHNDLKENLLAVSPKKFYSRLLYQNPCDFNIMIYYGRIFQQYFREMFVKVESKTLPWLHHNQSKLRASDYTNLCDLLADAATNKNEVNE